MKTFIIIHGYLANKNTNWFPWLRHQIESDKLGKVVSVSLPNTNNPKVHEWIEVIKNLTIANQNDDLYLIGHSLGCIAVIDAISEYKINVKGIFLVSGFCQKIPAAPELEAFTNIKLDWEFLKKIETKLCITAFNDTITDYQETVYLAKQLNSNCLILKTGGHFIQKEKVYQLPELFEAIKLIN